MTTINYVVLVPKSSTITPDEFEEIGPRFCPEMVVAVDGKYFLHFVQEVIEHGNHKMLNYLIQHFPDIKRNIDQSESELLALSLRIRDVNQAMKCTQILLNAGANVNLKRRDCTILQTSALNELPAPLIKLLLVHGASFGEFAHFHRELKEKLEQKSIVVEKLAVEIDEEASRLAQVVLATKSPQSPIAEIPSELAQKIFDIACDLFG